MLLINIYRGFFGEKSDNETFCFLKVSFFNKTKVKLDMLLLRINKNVLPTLLILLCVNNLFFSVWSELLPQIAEFLE